MFVRSEDGVLILPPNQVYRLNEGGLRILGHLLAGRPIARFPGIADGERAREVQEFCADLRDFYQGDASGIDDRASVERIPYTFDFTRLPILGEIAVTYACNNACRFCYAGCGTAGVRRRARVGAAPPMSLAAAKRVIDVFERDAQIPFFSFTGGEPLLHPDLEAMIRHARRRGLEVNLVTNGTLADPARARSPRPRRPAHRAGQRRSARGGPPRRSDREPRVVRTDARGHRQSALAGISVQTNTTVTALERGPRALHARIPEVARRRAVRDEPVHSLGGAAQRGAVSAADPLFFPYSRIGPVIDAVRAAARAEGLMFYWYSPTPHCLYNPIARGLGNKSCAAMDGLLSVSPTGDVLPCSSYPKPMGNLLRDGFREIWFSDGCTAFQAQGIRARRVRRVRELPRLPGRLPAVLGSCGHGGDTQPGDGRRGRRPLKEQRPWR